MKIVEILCWVIVGAIVTAGLLGGVLYLKSVLAL